MLAKLIIKYRVLIT